MSDSTNIQKAVDKILNFTGFFLTLGDLKQTDLLIAIANRDPEFTYYFETVTKPIETALDFFKVYANWAISRIRAEYNTVWDEVKDACACSEKYKILKMQCADTTVLWDLLQEIMGQ